MTHDRNTTVEALALKLAMGDYLAAPPNLGRSFSEWWAAYAERYQAKAKELIAVTEAAEPGGASACGRDGPAKSIKASTRREGARA